ncbi:MAG: hypothetical protein OIN88_08000 [Candidatus Methanoperedens sp.]|nr:hypothetical protein [Candidatus Methanoperedens sp.]
MPDMKILGLMLKEEFRLQASFFNRSYFLFSSLLFLFTSLTLSFLLGISFSVLLFTVLSRRGGAVLIIAMGTYLGYTGIDLKGIATQLPSLVFYYSHSFFILPGVITTTVVLAAVSSLLMKEIPAPHERRAKETYRKTAHLTSRLVSQYGAVLSKDIIDLVRSGIILPVISAFLMPLLFLFAITWFLESVMNATILCLCPCPT